MRIDLINTGSELLLGRVLNTHQQWICRRLADLGLVVSRQVAVPDEARAIEEALRDSLARVNLIIMTGGLGPTSDDVTRQVVAGLLGIPLEEDALVLSHIRNLFAARRRPMPVSTQVQALVPRGATVFMNAHGTAPGLALQRTESESSSAMTRRIILLPGPPRELRPMFDLQVVPYLEQAFPDRAAFVCRTLKTTGMGESVLEEKIAPGLAGLVTAGLEIGYCARVGEVDVRLAARGVEAQSTVNAAEAIVRELLSENIYATGDDSLEATLVSLLAKAGKTVCVAESCTGGFIANRFTNVPGASGVFLAGFITYSNQSKIEMLGVDPKTLEQSGAVSEDVARQMAEGARARGRADYSFAVTGIAGPDGGSAAKPVGTVYVALARAGSTKVLHRINTFDRETFKYVTSQQAFELLRRELVS